MALQGKRLTTSELAIQLKRAPETLVRWRRLRSGPPYMRVQGRVLYDERAVEKWLQEQTVAVGDPR